MAKTKAEPQIVRRIVETTEYLDPKKLHSDDDLEELDDLEGDEDSEADDDPDEEDRQAPRAHRRSRRG